MEYTAPSLHLVGKAESLVLGGIPVTSTDNPVTNSLPTLEVIGLDD